MYTSAESQTRARTDSVIDPPGMQDPRLRRTEAGQQGYVTSETETNASQFFGDDQIVRTIMAATSLPLNTETMYVNSGLGAQDSMPMRTQDRQIGQINASLFSALDVMTPQEFGALFVAMINLGNMYDTYATVQLMESEKVAAVPAHDKFLQIAKLVLSYREDNMLKYARYMMYNGLTETFSPERIKQQFNLPSEIVFDVLSFKVPMSPAEYFMQFTRLQEVRLTPDEFTILNSVAGTLKEVIKTKLEELRMYHRHGQILTSEKIDTFTSFMELRVGAQPEVYQQLSDELLGFGDVALVDYVTNMMHFFSRGTIPGAIDPGIIMGSHDVLSISELQAGIVQLAESQLYQFVDTNAQNRDRHTAAGIAAGFSGNIQITDPVLTARQNMSMNRASIVTSNLMAVLGATSSFSQDKYKIKDKGIQAAGGPNSMLDQFYLAQTDQIPKFDPLQTEVLRQALSVLLACLRIRLNAVQQTPWELVPYADLLHLAMVERLAQYVEPAGGQAMQSMASFLIGSSIRGHNMIKYEKMNEEYTQLTEFDQNQIQEAYNYHVTQQLRQIPHFVQNPDNMQYAVRSMDTYLASENRAERFQRERTLRRRTYLMAQSTHPVAQLDADLEVENMRLDKKQKRAVTAQAKN